MTATRRLRTWRRPALLALAAVAGLLVALAALALVVRLLHDGEALPGTEIAGISASGMSGDELRRRLAAATDPQRPLVVVAGERTLRIRPARAGYAVDLDGSVERALDAGRGGALGGLPATLKGLVASRDVALAATVDPSALDRAVASLARRVDRPSFPGRLEISDDGTRVDAEPPRAGRRLDRAQLRERLRAAMLGRAPGPVRVAVRERPVVSAAEVDDVVADAELLLSRPLVLAGGGEPLPLEPARLAGVLVLEPLDGGRRVRLGVDDEQLSALVARVAEQRDRPPRDARVEAPARATTVDGKGDLTWRPQPADVSVEPAAAGRTVDREALSRSIARAVHSGSHRARLPVERAEPQVTTAQAREVSHLIGTFTTYYEGGQPRVTNIRTMAATVDGTRVAPGERFSLNGVVGERTRAKGYVPAPFIADGRLVPSVGGGVSQFATTIYNAAFFAGLQLDTSQPHSLYIDRYPPGREATLNYPDIDLAWTNDTGAPVLVRASADETSVTVSLYGNNGGRTVTAETGSRRPVPGGDFAIDVTRVVRYGDGRTDRSTRTTTYDLLDE
ncbi:VanW family protein [Conexibacter arvalis]|uniref:Vancomycin resistance protein YoaR n=1 Tax=Conexibacter arvalis TaxID=912552 RepID=A0A840IJ49_9ACTN|nr:VanW family protein [Conexibacter arvalis]MBB4664251.1 vancomycin resistance protein YoaR [Conexibacter arvalis]